MNGMSVTSFLLWASAILAAGCTCRDDEQGSVPGRDGGDTDADGTDPPDGGDSDENGGAGTGSYDECEGLLGDEAQVRALEWEEELWLDCGVAQSDVFASEKDLAALWAESTKEPAPAVDFDTEQVVCFSTSTACGTFEDPDGFFFAKGDASMLYHRIRADQEGRHCDCPGRRLWFLWATPLAKLLECRHGDKYESG